MKTYIYNAASGNPTALVFGKGIDRNQYATINNRLQKDFPEVEQVGFYEEVDGVPRLQMAGGEFCGNATRSFACFLKDLNPDMSEFTYKVSGFPNLVKANVYALDEKKYFCRAIFNNFNYSIKEIKLDNCNVKVVDLGGIVHVVVNEKDRPFKKDLYEQDLKTIKNQLGIDCGAVGVLWIKEKQEKVFMKPVVWVKEIDTCYYETSCGSGSIAVGLVKTGGNGKIDVIQPSGKIINVEFGDKTMSLSSEMARLTEV